MAEEDKNEEEDVDEDEEEYEDDDEEYEDDDEEWEDDDEEWEDDEDDGKADDAEEKKAKRKKILIIVAGVVGVIAVLAGIWYALKLFGVTEAVFGKPNVTEVTLELGKPVTHTLPELRTDLKRSGRKTQFVKMTIIVQLNEKDLSALTDPTKTAEVMDGIKTHLRGLEFKELLGKKGSERLRFELVQVVNHVLAPVQVHNILFKDLLIQ